MQAQQQLLAGSRLRLPADDAAYASGAKKAAQAKAAAQAGGEVKSEGGGSADAPLTPILSTCLLYTSPSPRDS